MGQNKGNTLNEFAGKNWTVFFILFLAILGTYYESLPYPFLNLDDPYYITNNSFIRDLTWEGIYKIFSRPIVDNYFPLQILSYALDFQIWHIQPFGYRLHNVALHILNAALVFLLLKKIFSNVWVSFFGALFFGLHPVNVESVTWVAERKNVLSFALTLSSFLVYLYYLEESRATRMKGLYLITLFLFLLAILAKVSAVVLPLLFILYDFCFHRRNLIEMVRDKIPFLALAFFFAAVTVWVYQSSNNLAGFHGGSPYNNFLAVINVFIEYVIYLAVPEYLDHFYWTSVPQTIFERQVILSISAIFLLALLAWWSFRKDRVFFFWLGWFFISLLPVLNIVPITILRADRYMYLPAIGFFYLVSLGLWKITLKGDIRFSFAVFFSCSLALAGVYGFLTVERNRIWKDPVIFWEASLRKFPQSPWPYRYIGSIYADRGKNDLAISYFRSGLLHHPNDTRLLNGLAIAHRNKKELRQAEELLLRAISINPEDSWPYINLGSLFYQKGETAKAISYLKKALEVDPQNAGAHGNLGAIYYNLKRWEETIRESEKAIELSPGMIEPYLNIARVYKRTGKIEKAESYLKRGLDYSPESHAALFILGRLLFEQDRYQEAEDYLGRAYLLLPQDRHTAHYLNLIRQRKENPSFPPGEEENSISQGKFMEFPLRNP